VPENELSDSTATFGGAAPADRQCQYTKSDGHRCRDWALRGHDNCARHHRFAQYAGHRPIDVPLLEDEDSLVLLLSQTLRALAWGAIPVSNGRAILNGCRLAHSIQCRRLEAAKFRLKLRRLNIPENEIFAPGSSEPVLSQGQPEDGTRRTDLCLETDAEPERGTQSTERDPQDAGPGTRCPETDAEPCPAPDPPEVRFRDLKKNWDKDLLHGENELTDMYAPRYGETREEFRASRVKPFDHLAEVDREIEKARAMAAALPAESASLAVSN
jgi:hypothetical protein